MIRKTITLIFSLIAMNGINASKQSVKDCILRVINKSSPENLFAQSQLDLTQVILQFKLFDEKVQNQLRKCRVDNDSKKLCEKKFGLNECEECGMVYVKRCEKGYKRIDCGMCAKQCPKELIEENFGTLCKKDEMIKRSVYNSMEECLRKNKKCTQYDKMASSNCPASHNPTSPFLCSARCPDGFEESSYYCKPPLVKNFRYFFSNLEHYFYQAQTA